MTTGSCFDVSEFEEFLEDDGNDITMFLVLYLLDDEDDDGPARYFWGKGNAKAGERQEYFIRQACSAESIRSMARDPNLWRHNIMFEPDDFFRICDSLRDAWSAPRYGTTPRPRKHSIESSFFGTLATLKQNYKVHTIQGILKDMNVNTPAIDFWRNLDLIIEQYSHEIEWPDAEERALLRGMIDGFPNCVAMVDGTDVPIFVGKGNPYAWVFASYKLKDTAGRIMIGIDYKGEIRKVSYAPAGVNNDQSMMTRSCLNDGTHFSPGETIMGDGGYFSTPNISVERPATFVQRAADPSLIEFNSELSSERSLVERCIGLLKLQFQILMTGFRRDRKRFYKVVHACAILYNLRGRMYGFPNE